MNSIQSSANACREANCDGKTFNRPADLQRHSREVHGPPLECNYPNCKYKVQRIDRLIKHVKQIHSYDMNIPKDFFPATAQYISPVPGPYLQGLTETSAGGHGGGLDIAAHNTLLPAQISMSAQANLSMAQVPMPAVTQANFATAYSWDVDSAGRVVYHGLPLSFTPLDDTNTTAAGSDIEREYAAHLPVQDASRGGSVETATTASADGNVSATKAKNKSKHNRNKETRSKKKGGRTKTTKDN